MKIKLLGFLCVLLIQQLHAQTLTDGLMMSKKNLCTGFVYSTDSWKNYWEGSVKRDNLNIGTITTNSAIWMGSYGLTDKINLIAMVPYVSTNSTGPTLHSMQGVQDLTLGGKYKLLNAALGSSSISAFAGASFSCASSSVAPFSTPAVAAMFSATP